MRRNTSTGRRELGAVAARESAHRGTLDVRALAGCSSSGSARQVAHLFGYCFHQQTECFFEARRSSSAPLVMPQAHHDELMRRNDQRSLTARAGHVIRFTRHRKSPLPVYPKEAAVNRTIIGLPRWRERADELHESLGQNPLALPNTILKIKVRQPSPVAS